VETAALMGDLEPIPRRKIEYRGVVLDEMDVDAVLKRHPTVALVDELAHTNAPDCRNGKRYQDVEELLNAGIHVITTMNVQHLESLYDQIESFTGVKVKERVPDYILHQADQVVNVDLPAEDLQERMRAGKIYPLERAGRALDNFFTEANLTRLREISLEELALALDQRRQQKGPEQSGGSERVMVCLSSRAPNAHRLLRKAARLADRFHAPWYAIYIQTPGERVEKIDAATQRNISDQLALAQQLGGISMPFRGVDFAKAVAAFVQEYGITHIVLGRTRRPWYRRWFGQSPLDQLLHAVSGVDVTVVDTV
jgi:two-component system sensor histidine kinase KdpD